MKEELTTGLKLYEASYSKKERILKEPYQDDLGTVYIGATDKQEAILKFIIFMYKDYPLFNSSFSFYYDEEDDCYEIKYLDEDKEIFYAVCLEENWEGERII